MRLLPRSAVDALIHDSLPSFNIRMGFTLVAFDSVWPLRRGRFCLATSEPHDGHFGPGFDGMLGLTGRGSGAGCGAGRAGGEGGFGRDVPGLDGMFGRT